MVTREPRQIQCGFATHLATTPSQLATSQNTISRHPLIEFGDSYKAPLEETGKGPASESSAKKKGKTVVITTKDMQKRRNDVKARTTLLLALPDEHQLRFSKYETAQELWEAILKTFGGNEATKKTKKNQLKQQYGNFKAEGSETLEQTFNRLQAIVSHLEFMDVEIEQDDLNQKFLTSLAPEWLMYTIVWRNIDDLDTMSLDDVGKDEVHTASVPTASTQVSTASTDIKYEDITQIDEDDIKEMDIKWNMALLSMMADRECRAPRSQDRGRRESYKQGHKEEEPAPKELIAIDGIGWDLSYIANEEENHALVADDEAPTEFALMAKSSSSSKNEFPPPPAQVYSPPKKDISWTGLPEFVDDTVTDYSRPTPKSSSSIMSKPMIKFVKATDCPGVIKTNKTETARKSPVKYAEMYRNTSKSPKVRGEIWPKNNFAHKNVTPRAVLLKTGRIPIAVNRTNMNVAQPKMTSFAKTAHSNVRRPFQGKLAVRTQSRVPKVSTVTKKFPTVDSKFSTAKSTFTTDLGTKGKDVKALACWIWIPKQKTNEKGLNCNGVSVTFKKYQYIDTKGRLKLGHLNFKTMNKLVRNNLVKGLPSKCFENDHTCVACLKGKQHKASCKTKFTWTFFLRTKNETSGILRNFITEIENLKDLKMKIIRCDNGGEFKNKEMNEFCTKKGIKREFSNAWTLQQNRVAERRNKTLIEAARTMLADAKLPVTFWAEAVNTACYVQNRVLVNKFFNTLDHLGKFDAKGDECYFVEYSMSSKAFRVFNKRTKKVEENLHVDFLENNPIKKGAVPNWLFNIDTLTNSMNYVPVVVAKTSSTNISGTKDVASQAVKKDVSSLRYIALPNWFHEAHMESSNSDAQDAFNADVPQSSGISNPTATSKIPPADQMESLTVKSKIPTVSSSVPTVCLDISPKTSNTIGVEADLSNMGSSIPASPTPTFRIHKDHPKSQIIGPVDTPVQTRYKSKEMEEYSFITTIHQKTNPGPLQFCLFSCFLSQEEPKKIFDALKDPRVRPIGIKWVLKNKKHERGIVIRNKARLVVQGYTQEEGIDYEEVFAPVVRIEAIRLFLAYASFMGFIVYQMDVKSAFLYGTIDEEVYVMQPFGFQDPEFPDKVYKVEKAMYGLHQAPRAWYGTLSKYLLDNGFQRGTIDQTLFITKHKGEFLLVQVYVDDIIFGSLNLQLCREFEALMHDKFQMSSMGELAFFLGLQVLQKKDGIFLSQDKYVGDILKKFRYSDVRSMIGSLMYLTASRPDIMFAVCACARHQVTPKECHLHVVKRIFRYLKGHPKLGLWYPKESPFDFVAYSDSDYGGATQDRKSTTGGCQFLGRRLILWQFKKQTIVATSTTEAEYVAAASGYGQVLWIQNLMLDYGFGPLQGSKQRMKKQRFSPLLMGEGSAIPTEPHHTPSPQEQHLPHHDPSSPSHPTTTTEPIPQTPTETPTETPTLRQYSKRATRIAQSKALSPAADEPASLLRDDSQGEAFSTVSSLDARQDMKNINKTSSLPHKSSPRVTSLDADEGRESMEIKKEVRVERSTELESNDTEEMVNVLSSIEAANILISGVAAVSVSPVAGVSTVGVPTVSGLFPTISAIFTTASVVTPYSRRPRGISAKDKGKEKVVESELARDSKIARLHAKEELKMMIEGLNRSNEVIAKHLQEYEQAAADLSVGEKIELINELEQREFYMCVLRSHAGWKTKHFRGMTLEEIKEKFIPVWKQLEDFMPMSSKEEGERIKRKGLKLDQGSAKRMKTSEDVSEEELKEMMQLVPLEEVYVESLQVKHPIIGWEIHSEGQREEDLHQLWTLVKETLSIKHATKDKEKELWVELKRLFEPDFEDQLWTHNQAFIHDPLEWKTRVGGFFWEMMEIHGRSSGSGGEGRGNCGRVVMGLAGDGASE
uniref:Integrase catalytic domain-containing protein n=1 Tax=Tanacetum cinerariifolium TaxID=118510 RepID=A0A6L2L0N1_TANCI|nr:hypothetical protein [Tanacetum cinerariifolium]